MFKKILGSIGIGALILVVLCTISWLTTCGLVWLITWCFGIEFSWAIATGVWLVLFLAKCAFSRFADK